MQDWIVSLDVMDEIQCFWSQIKAENVRIHVMQLMWQKIEMMEFCVQIEWTYKFNAVFSAFIMYNILYIFYTQQGWIKKEKKTKTKKNSQPKRNAVYIAYTKESES